MMSALGHWRTSQRRWSWSAMCQQRTLHSCCAESDNSLTAGVAGVNTDPLDQSYVERRLRWQGLYSHSSSACCPRRPAKRPEVVRQYGPRTHTVPKPGWLRSLMS
jgi:hypothetical protein